jgi:F-type H+-transporting ATPase subunit b
VSLELLSNAQMILFAKADIFQSLGVDLQTLIFQIIAFLVLVFLLGKFAYPTLIEAADRHQKEIDESAASAENVQKIKDQSKTDYEELLKKAHEEAGEIVHQAKEDAESVVKNAEDDANKRANTIIDNANNQIKSDIEAAKKNLYNDTIEFVTIATEKVTKEKMNSTEDQTLIKKVVEELR